MGTIKKLSLFCFISLLSTFCFARQLCFQIVQHDSAAKELTEQSLTIEDEVLNSFFDYGFIVTNSNATISNSQNQDETLFETGLKDAFNGYSDIFIQIQLFFEQNDSVSFLYPYSNLNFLITRQQACIQIAVAIYTQACLRTSLFCFLLYQLSLWWVKYRAQPEAIST